MLQQVKKSGTVEIFQYRLPKLLQEWLTTKKSINRHWFKKKSAVEFMRVYAKYFSRRLDRDLRKRPVDILFVAASPQLVAYAKTSIPIIYMTDASFRQLQGYYPGFSNLAEKNIRQGIELDKRTFRKASHLLLASEWCRDSAVNDYGINPGKISVVPLGANLDRIPVAAPESLLEGSTCNLLFLGVEWERKGGPIALETYRAVKAYGIPARLQIIGCVPPVNLENDKDIRITPFLDKNLEKDFHQLHQVFLETDFLLLPTRAECAGIVFSEASAYGIPSFTTDTGGVTTYVRNGVNGYALPQSAEGSDYAERIRQLLSDPAELERMRKTARNFYETYLAWDNWGKRFGVVAAGCLQQKAEKE